MTTTFIKPSEFYFRGAEEGAKAMLLEAEQLRAEFGIAEECESESFDRENGWHGPADNRRFWRVSDAVQEAARIVGATRTLTDYEESQVEYFNGELKG
jgi:hypothetical protein